MNTRKQMIIVIAASMIAAVSIAEVSMAQLLDDEARLWVSRGGKSRVEGILLEVSSDGLEAVIQRSDSAKKVHVPVEKLSAIDFLYVQDFRRRSTGSLGASEDEPIPLAHLPDNDWTKPWVLTPAIRIFSPKDAGLWKVISSRPILFGGYAVDSDEWPMMTVLYEPGVDKPNDREIRIQEANQASRLFLEERGVADPKGELLKTDPSLNSQSSRLGGITKDGQELFCETVLRFDHEMMLVFRVFGTADENAERLAGVVDQFQYIEPEPPVLVDVPSASGEPSSEDESGAQETQVANSGSAASGPATTDPAEATNSAPSPAPSKIPNSVRADFDLFAKATLELLAKPNNAQEVIETLAHPEGLSRLKQNAQRWDTAIIAFDVRKRQRLVTLMQTLDWSSADYSISEDRLSFARPDLVDFIRTQSGWKIVN